MRFAASQQRKPLFLSERDPSVAAGMGNVGGAGGIVNVPAIASQIDSGNMFEDIYNDALKSDFLVEASRLKNEKSAIDAAYQAKTAEEGLQMYQDALEPKTADFNPLSAAMDLGSIVLSGISLFSDERLKDKIEELNDALTVIRKLRPVSYYYNEESGLNTTRKHYGFIAQEYFKEMPDAVYTDDVRGYLKIDTQELIGVLVKAVQELDTELKDLKKSLEYSEYSS